LSSTLYYVTAETSRG